MKQEKFLIVMRNWANIFLVKVAAIRVDVILDLFYRKLIPFINLLKRLIFRLMVMSTFIFRGSVISFNIHVL